eukprot:CAMPEP_0176429172 /NCGR_PEP_ID=MMETSP0127-20121128/13566_1 /TAXON_ID=938130 /ORGANISM="Platyophrya macrostoma, Strain WH" /LENGTH=281 /DNA_ID=CAMNT_0017810953 /DNA_START=16 /DNA_END=859 /DNA_ORIENTATION=-
MACARPVNSRIRIPLAPRTTEKPDVLSRTPLSDGCARGKAIISSSGTSSWPSTLSVRHQCRASRILPLLFLGSEDDAKLLESKIHYILNVAMESEPSSEVRSSSTFVDESLIENCLGSSEETDEEMTDGPMEQTPFTSSHGVKISFPKPTMEKPLVYLHIRLADSVDADIKSHFRLSNLFIHEALKRNSGVLVHCRVGVSRSAAFVLAYLIENGQNPNFQNPMSYDSAFEHVRNIRETINPNMGFAAQLTDFARDCGAENSSSCFSSPQPNAGFPGSWRSD